MFSMQSNNQQGKKDWLVKASLHTEMQKFGQKPDTRSPIFDSLDKETKKELEEYKIHVIGIDNTEAQNRALFAIQKLLSETDYKGNLEGKELDRRNRFLYQGYLPALRFTTSQYLEAYGVGKSKTARGWMEFNMEERRVALQALKDLNDKKYLFYYERKYWITIKKGKKEERFDLIRTVRPLISITEGYEALTKLEKDTVLQDKADQNTNEKLRYIAIEPCPILVDQINTYFILKPANYRQEIALTTSQFKVSKYTYLFIDYLMAQAEMKRRTKQELVVRISPEELAYKLRLECYLKTRNYKKICQIIDNACETARKLNYLLDYKTIPRITKKELDEFILSPQKFDRALAILEQRKIIDENEEKSQRYGNT